jgi:hypothetical protein
MRVSACFLGHGAGMKLVRNMISVFGVALLLFGAPAALDADEIQPACSVALVSPIGFPPSGGEGRMRARLGRPIAEMHCLASTVMNSFEDVDCRVPSIHQVGVLRC